MDVLPSLREMLADGWAAFPGWAALVAAIALVWITRIRLDERARTPVLALLVVCGSLYAWQLRWLADDAYIPFRYAYNWVHGQGIVWNPGERVEGYTSFLWVLMAAASLAVHLDPQKVS